MKAQYHRPDLFIVQGLAGWAICDGSDDDDDPDPGGGEGFGDPNDI